MQKGSFQINSDAQKIFIKNLLLWKTLSHMDEVAYVIDCYRWLVHRAFKPVELIPEIADAVHNRVYANAKSRRAHPIQLVLPAGLICSTLITTFVRNLATLGHRWRTCSGRNLFRSPLSCPRVYGSSNLPQFLQQNSMPGFTIKN